MGIQQLAWLAERRCNSDQNDKCGDGRLRKPALSEVEGGPLSEARRAAIPVPEF
jgi:hypothetical protein